MHIPAAPTQDLKVLTFSDALRGTESPHYDRSKWLYVPDFYSEYRYLLGVRGKNPLICIGVNPSTAAPDTLDNTLKSVQRIAAGNGYDGWVMCNVYAQRATRPEDMDRALNEALHRENLKAFEYVLQLAAPDRAPAVWAAWGAVIEKRPYLPRCVLDFVEIGRQYGAQWWKAGAVSKAGHPHHPLYLRKDAPMEPFDVARYLQRLITQQKGARNLCATY